MKKTKTKIFRYMTNKVCCKNYKSLIEITILECISGETYSAECTDCGKIIKGHRNVKNLLVTTNPIITPYLLNKANQN